MSKTEKKSEQEDEDWKFEIYFEYRHSDIVDFNVKLQ